MNRARWLIMAALWIPPTLGSLTMQLPAQEKKPDTIRAGQAPQAKVTNPHGPIAIPCQNCHTYTSWRPVRSNPEFDHDQTSYPLRGMHQKVECTKCHTSLIFKNTAMQCADCHADIHRRQFGANCEKCHTVKGWQVNTHSIRNHDNRFPLVGAHALVECDQCHKNAAAGQFVGLLTSCYGCHEKEFLTPVIDHTGLKFPSTCESCHSINTWFDAKFDHLQYTGYALTGAHAPLACSACHLNNVFTGTSAQCYSCHNTDFASTNNPPHAQIGLPRDCGTCHTTLDWSNATFDHGVYAHWPLTGKHATVACVQCHTNNNYVTTSADCFGCHQKDFISTADPPHQAGGYPTNCALCHTTSGWTPSSFDHNTAFPLTGAHAAVACSQCHVNNNYVSLPTDCFGCHSTDFNNSNNPSHVSLSLPHTCGTCHTTSDWLNAKFDHSAYAHYPLTGAHASVPCAQCHMNNNYASTSSDCYSCHARDFTDAANPNHVTSGFQTNCSLCHSTGGWTPSSFNHNAAFVLTGAHASVACAQCHTNGNYTSLPKDCFGCHQADFATSNNPSHVALTLPHTCETCHTTTNWFNAKFDHTAYANYTLTGAHTALSCAQCHLNDNFSTTSTACYACHQGDFTRTTTPKHAPAGFPTNCALCHTTTAWAPSSFNHAAVFPLTGAHATVACASCHTKSNYTSSPTECVGCHQKDFAEAVNPNHTASGFPTDCTLCHTTSAWHPSTFNHAVVFALTGAHKALQCAQCHTNNNYKTLPSDCFACHKSDWKGTNNPGHAAAGFPTTCATCHSTTSWGGAVFNHNNTPFPLTGAHAQVACSQCHANNVFTGVSTSCYSCHQKDFTGTQNPNHVATGFPTDCSLCHTTTTFATSTFNHSSVFVLTGVHASTPCQACHVGNNFTALPKDCYGCHSANYSSASNPNHVSAGFPTTCAVCHDTTAWTDAVFNHSATAFPLTGAHTSVTCASCHVNNNYTTLPTNCYGCHQADFKGTSNPSHAASGFPTNCTLCHTTTAWTGSTFNHSSVFPLLGAHANLQCASCHVNNNYTTVPTNCYGCHQADFTGTGNPGHVAAGFPTTCNACHTNTDWSVVGMTFNHTLYANYALTGSHATLTCVRCHQKNNYTSTSTACYGCHQSDFSGTTEPNHVASGFPTDCSICHTTSAWNPSSFNHNSTPFPLTGAHAALQCALCHTKGNYTSVPTTCIGCHQADYNGTNSPNHAAAGFPTACTTCHTTASWAGATFNHNSTPFPLTGAHVNVGCNQCHINNVFAGTPTGCYSCHASGFNGTTNPNHASAGWPTTCTTCHTTSGWVPANLPASYHAFFPIKHGEQNGTCTNCHSNSSDYSVFSCTSCHGGNNPANFHHPNVSGYQYLSSACYQCHKNGQGD